MNILRNDQPFGCFIYCDNNNTEQQLYYGQVESFGICNVYFCSGKLSRMILYTLLSAEINIHWLNKCFVFVIIIFSNRALLLVNRWPSYQALLSFTSFTYKSNLTLKQWFVDYLSFSLHTSDQGFIREEYPGHPHQHMASIFPQGMISEYDLKAIKSVVRL